MGKLIIAGMVAGLMFGSTVHAADDTAGLKGSVASNCFVSGVDVQLTFPSVTAGEFVTDSDVVILCNDADGATLSLRSSEGGLESDDNEDQEIEYVATLANAVIGGGFLVLDTGIGGQGNNDVEEETVLAASSQLSAGSTGSLTVVLSDTGAFAGGYSDTLSINIEAQ